ncbi:pseudouridine-5'-phosphate glycosidase [Piscibacillus halophilus]|uniref:Pseudouridine-5'-phosphate glycosidase n=1 Tax=Piscibacillus halophilus TaxID=571933 RepID=A0A1H9JVE5_9BACI|nr:pseudouridine-5'-phosphate glycosidase [Piscibacillus halophilus]
MSYLKISEEVQNALDSGKPIVALESTIISHGFPYPNNVKLANEVEETIRSLGVVPATIAILDGQIHVGLSKDEIELLGKAPDAYKTSIHDIPRVLSSKKNRCHYSSRNHVCSSISWHKIFCYWRTWWSAPWCERII